MDMTSVKNTVLYFDLENTLIRHWTDERLCWVESNKLILEHYKPKEIGIFSFALWCDENIKKFINEGMKDKIEETYGVLINVDEIIHVNDMISAYDKVNTDKNHPGSDNKYDYFMSWIRVNSDKFRGFTELILVDDTVEDQYNQKIESVYPNVSFINPTTSMDGIL
jgi:hypothetical protein